MNRGWEIRFNAFVILFLMFSFSSGRFAQSRGGVKGLIKDSQSSEPLSYANVALKGTTSGTMTDDDGRYQLLNIRPGTYTLVFSYLSYRTIEQELVISSGEIKTSNGAMTKFGKTEPMMAELVAR